MRKGRISVAGASILFALGLAAWEVYFFWYAGSFPELAGRVGLFTPDRLGFNMAWLAALCLAGLTFVSRSKSDKSHEKVSASR